MRQYNNKNKGYITKIIDQKSDLKRKFKLIIEEEYITESDSPFDIEKIISGMEESQIEVMAKNLSDRIYNGEKLDLNKINTISRVSGIDIMQRVNDMKSFVES